MCTQHIPVLTAAANSDMGSCAADAPHNCMCLDVVFHNEQEQADVEDNSGVHLVLSPQPEPSQAALLK